MLKENKYKNWCHQTCFLATVSKILIFPYQSSIKKTLN